MIIQAYVAQRKQVPQWMVKNVWPNRYTDESSSDRHPKVFHLPLTLYGPIIWIVSLLIGSHYIARVDYARGNVVEIILFETSFPLFLVATWLLPVYFLRRYLRKLKPGEVNFLTNSRNYTSLLNHSCYQGAGDNIHIQREGTSPPS
jgi:hypothetical protein